MSNFEQEINLAIKGQSFKGQSINDKTREMKQQWLKKLLETTKKRHRVLEASNELEVQPLDEFDRTAGENKITEDEYHEWWAPLEDENKTPLIQAMFGIWGYRTLPNGDHERFEKASDREIQFWSDPVMRTAQQLFQTGRTYFTIDVLAPLSGHALIMTNMGELSKNLLLIYFVYLDQLVQGTVERILKMDVADHPDVPKHSLNYTAMVSGFRALAMLAVGQFRQAQRYLSPFVSRYKSFLDAVRFEEQKKAEKEAEDSDIEYF